MPSPFTIRDLFDGATGPVWADTMRSLELPHILDADRSPEEPLSCHVNAPCRASLTTLSGLTRGIISVTLCDTFGSRCRIILFSTEGPNRWKVLGHIDQDNDWGVSVSSEPPFVIVNGQNRAGTGVWANFDDWYEITDRGLRRVLRTLNRGHDVDAKPALYFRGVFLHHKQVGQQEVIEYLYRLKCEDYATNLYLFDERRLVRFVRAKGAAEFEMDEKNSELTDAEIDKFYFYDTDFTPAEFITFARASLLRLARSGNQPQKSWLRNYLARAPASPIKSELLRTLGAERTK